MRLLILTQALDTEDAYLSFFHSWANEFARHFESVRIICLKEGAHELPSNVRVYSLGKEEGKGRFTYVARFIRYITMLRNEYDVVLVHQNQEYVLLGGWIWKMFGKPVYLWRNHYKGSFLTRVAAVFTKKVFCTSQYSYTASFARTVLMPIGIDTEIFKKDPTVQRTPRSILFYARMAPSKKAEIFVEALALLTSQQVAFTAIVKGSPLPYDESYHASVRTLVSERGLADCVRFEPGEPFANGPRIFSGSEIYVNLGGSGMYDKTIFEAAACGALSVASSKDYAMLADPRLTFTEGDAHDLAKTLSTLLDLDGETKEKLVAESIRLAYTQSLRALAETLQKEMSN